MRKIIREHYILLLLQIPFYFNDIIIKLFAELSSTSYIIYINLTAGFFAILMHLKIKFKFKHCIERLKLCNSLLSLLIMFDVNNDIDFSCSIFHAFE